MQGDEERLVAPIRQRLDDSLRSLDPGTAARLRQARQHAIEQGKGVSRHPALIPGAVLASAAVGVLVLALWPSAPEIPPPDLAAQDIDVLTAADDLEILEDLEFFEWLVMHEGPG